MSQHTPGPWTVGEDEGTSKAHEILRKGHVVAWTCSHDPYEEGNARLIAAAPEMLAILQTLKTLQDTEHKWGTWEFDTAETAIRAARALLARIEGESKHEE